MKLESDNLLSDLCEDAGMAPADLLSYAGLSEEDLAGLETNRSAATGLLQALRTEARYGSLSKSRETKRFRVLSMFSGCGGMDLGFIGDFEFLGRRYDSHPFEIAWANELNAAACRTYRANVGAEIHEGDIWAYFDQLPAKGEIDIVIGGFPCQDISVNGKGRGVDGHRSGLYRAMVEVVDRLRPKVFVAENVKGLLMRHNKSSLDRVVNDFESLGYTLSVELYNAAEFGVPQSRERVFIVGTAPGVSKMTRMDAAHGRHEWVTAYNAIHDLAELPEDETRNHIWSRAQRSAEQGDRRLKPDRVAYTMRAECHGNIQFHYALDRRISMREAARIQSFPDGFLFHSKLRETERQIGNAVPPVLAWHLAKKICQLLI